MDAELLQPSADKDLQHGAYKAALASGKNVNVPHDESSDESTDAENPSDNRPSALDSVEVSPLAAVRVLLGEPSTTFLETYEALIALPTDDRLLCGYRPGHVPDNNRCPATTWHLDLSTISGNNDQGTLLRVKAHIGACVLQPGGRCVRFQRPVPFPSARPTGQPHQPRQRITPLGKERQRQPQSRPSRAAEPKLGRFSRHHAEVQVGPGDDLLLVSCFDG